MLKDCVRARRIVVPRTRNLVVVPNKSDFPETGAHLLKHQFDVDLTVVIEKSSRGTRERPAPRLELERPAWIQLGVDWEEEDV